MSDRNDRDPDIEAALRELIDALKRLGPIKGTKGDT